MTPIPLTMHAELRAIAMHGELQVFHALDKLAAAMSERCEKCKTQLRDSMTKCPECGHPVKKQATERPPPEGEIKDGADLSDTGETGNDASVREDLNTDYMMESKMAAAKKGPSIKDLPLRAQNPAALAVILGGLAVGNEGRKALKPPAQKTAAARAGNPIRNLRRGWKGKKPSEALDKILKTTKRFTARGLPPTK